MRSLDWLTRRPIAHRGLHDLAKGVVENTRTAFAQAIERTYAIECDVQLTSDGEAAVFHDETLSRLMDSKDAVINRTMNELKALRYHTSGDRMQSLPELLDQVAGQVPIIIEIKSHWDGNPSLSTRVAECLSQYQGACAVMSFDPDVLDQLARIAPAIIRGIVADRVHDPYYQPLSLQRRLNMRTFEHLHTTHPHFVSFDFNGLPFAPVQQIRAQGFPVISWTITSPETASRARRYSDQITFENYHPS
jgi:glycerophosphoryl diester phosphodiesterase